MGEGTYIVNNPASIHDVMARVSHHLANLHFETATGEHMGYEIEIRPHMGRVRTQTQDNARFLWMTWYAKRLNDAGVDMKTFFDAAKDGVSVPWTKDTFHEVIWKGIMRAMTGADSSKVSSTKEVQEIERIISKFIAERFGVEAPPWPDRFGSAAEEQA